MTPGSGGSPTGQAEGPISSPKNPRVVAAGRLHRARHRRETGRTLIEGPQVLAEAARAGVVIHEVFGVGDSTSRRAADDAGQALQVVTEGVLTRIAGTATPRGPVAVISIPEAVLTDDRPLLVTWGVGDPGNCGTLLRTASAFGYGYAAGPGSADAWSPKVLRSAAGGHFRTSVGVVSALAELTGRHLVGTVAEGGAAPGLVASDAAVLVGSEAHGLPADVVAGCDSLVTIPMPGGTESLNAAVAGSIVAYLGVVGA